MYKTAIEWCEYEPHTRKRIVVKTGYTWVWCPEHPNANKGKKDNRGYIQEHRLIMSNYLKRPLTADEHVHHLNGNKSDNRIENLKLMTNSEHRALHMAQLTSFEKSNFAKGLIQYAKEKKINRRIVSCACGCGQQFETPDKQGRFHKFIQGHNTKGTHWKWKREEIV